MSKKLFDEENEFIQNEDEDSKYDELSVYIDDEEGSAFQKFGKFAVDENWLNSDKKEMFNSHEEYENKMLEENLYDIFKNSPFNNKYEGNKKVPKHEMVLVYLYFLDRISNPVRYTAVEKFIAIASFMKMNFETMYRELPIVYKEELLKEFNKKYQILTNKRSHKLF